MENLIKIESEAINYADSYKLRRNMERCCCWGGGTEITSGTATCNRAITANNYCKWVKSGHIVMVDIRTALGDGYNPSGYTSETFLGLPKPYIEIYLNYRDGSNYSKYSQILCSYTSNTYNYPLLDDYKLTVDGNLIIGAARYGGYFRDYFTYISSE